MTNNFSLLIATVNGSGSQSANSIIAKTLFRMGVPVGAKNLFPSNIAGLPTWFSIRANAQGFTSRQSINDCIVARNADTAEKDLANLKPGGFYFYDQEFKLNPQELRQDILAYAIPYREIIKPVSESIKIRKLLSNMVYVGILAEVLKFDKPTLNEVVQNQFFDKPQIVELNLKAIELGIQYARENWSAIKFPCSAESQPEKSKGKIFIDGNSAAALGAVVGGCTFMSWYPITPSSSLAESFQEYSLKLRKSNTGENNFAILQAEDELSSINMVLGAGWAGSRAMTATSGPGLSLMAESAGLSYFAEIPAVIWDVQRAGPSTGLPTRTMQCDLNFAATLSHGDTEHIVLLPANPGECYEFAQSALDIAEQIQTLVIVLSDLDIGMNFSIVDEFKIPSAPFNRGKVYSADDLNKIEDYARYRDVDGDGVGYRTLPGTAHVKAAYFTRGTGHNERSAYSEDGQNYVKLLDRLKLKLNKAREILPAPLVTTDLTAENSTDDAIGIIAYGSSDAVISELRHDLSSKNINSEYLRIRALPLDDSIQLFLDKFKYIFIVEQNRDAQMCNLLAQKFVAQATKLHSVVNYDGLPLTAEYVSNNIQKHLRGQDA